jgi:Tol biopolymer transport system component
MTQDSRWPRVEELYHAALERHESERATFLQMACAGDEALLREVESLLAEGSVDTFLTASALEAAARDMARSGEGWLGRELGAYQILSPLGSGGMGEVYRAHDARLGRDVAVKVLNAYASASASSVRRFQQEARAASGLNHPGIVTIHDAGECDGQFFIVMELVDGPTLRVVLGGGRPSLKKALRIASQLADALAKAHEVGIVHRDLKPENVMLTREGHVKIVDFGLAKLSEPVAIGSAAPVAAATGDRSTGRWVLGTLGYMSPEQATGEPADFRSDQFAFGAILYEIVTGTRAFQQPTSAETLSMIIRNEPTRALELNPALPLPLVWIIERCLSKDPADRYASTHDLARDLQGLRDRASELDTTRGQHVLAGDASRRRFVLGSVALTTALAVGLAGFYVAQSRASRGGAAGAATPVFQQLTFRRGFIQDARFTPDGEGVIYAAGWDGEPVRLFETRVSGPESRPIGPTNAGLAGISSKGELALIQGCRLDFGGCVGTLATMPLAGGAPRELLEDVVGAAWTPDGHGLAAIQIVGGEYQLQFPIGKTLHASAGKLESPAFSPGGDRIAFIELPLISEESGSLKLVDLEGRTTELSAGWRTISTVAWSPDGEEIWITASDRGRRRSLYAVSLTGARRLIFRAPGDLMMFDLFRDGRALLATFLSRSHMVWSSSGMDRDLSWLDWSTAADVSADGQTLLFYEWGEGVDAVPVVYVRKADGSDAVRLGPGKALALSPDGRWALALQETASPQLALLPTGAGESRPLPTHGLVDFYRARWFPDGKRILVVGSDNEAIPRSYVQDIETGQLQQIGEDGMLAFLPSRDGGSVVMEDPLGPYLLVPLDGGTTRPLEGLLPGDRPIQWSTNGRFLYLRGPEDDILRIYRYDPATRKRELWKELAPHDRAGLIGLATGRGELAMTPDGNSYVFTYWSILRHLFLAEGLPP